MTTGEVTGSPGHGEQRPNSLASSIAVVAAGEAKPTEANDLASNPHLSVRDNIAFSLSVAGAPKDVQARRANEIARLLQLDDLMNRKPAQLSGGQRQRVAIGRALIREPEVFLFDEPLSNLDAILRVQMRIELAKLHKALGTTMIYVTHDQVEAMTLANRIVVLDRGVVAQVGAPLELYEKPQNKFVASFIGSPTMNFLPVIEAKANGHKLSLGVARARRRIQVEARHLPDNRATRPAEISIRPEHVTVTDPSDRNAQLTGRILLVERLGNMTIAYVDTAAGQVVVQGGADLLLGVDNLVGVKFDPARIHVFADDGSAA